MPRLSRVRASSLALCLPLLALACGHHRSSPSPETGLIESLEGDWVVSIDEATTISGMPLPLGIEAAVLRADWIEESAGSGLAAFEAQTDAVAVPPLAMAIVGRSGAETSVHLGGYYYVPDLDVSVELEAAGTLQNGAVVAMDFTATLYSGAQLVEEQDPATSEFFWTIENNALEISRIEGRMSLTR
ncbi:MAG: hypothetical protein JNL08_13055 [Planctomycetes bacterium]|nr:hypothetical protein [Planctomycetota bacterium]